MNDSILDSPELNIEDNDGGDDEIAFVEGDTIYKNIIPILLMPEVIFPYTSRHPIVTDPHLKQLCEQSFNEKTVFGYLYRPEEEKEKLPPLQHVGVTANVTELSKLPDGSYLVHIFTVNRFYIKEYINADPNDLTARVAYYDDLPEDDEIIRPLALEFFEIRNRLNEMMKEYRKPTAKNDDADNPTDRVMLSLHAYTSFKCQTRMTENEKQYLLWMYKLSERLMILNEIMKEALPAITRVSEKTRPFRNN